MCVCVCVCVDWDARNHECKIQPSTIEMKTKLMQEKYPTWPKHHMQRCTVRSTPKLSTREASSGSSNYISWTSAECDTCSCSECQWFDTRPVFIFRNSRINESAPIWHLFFLISAELGALLYLNGETSTTLQGNFCWKLPQCSLTVGNREIIILRFPTLFLM
jgi:hypothetical protein